MKNPFLTEEERLFDGELWMYIQGADWKVDKNGQSICSSGNSNELEGVLVLGLKQLVGEAIEGFLLDECSHDLMIEMSGGIRLLFSPSRSTDLDDYSVSGQGLRTFTVAQGRLISE
jgi:hypothetical protein